MNAAPLILIGLVLVWFVLDTRSRIRAARIARRDALTTQILVLEQQASPSRHYAEKLSRLYAARRALNRKI